MCAARPFELSVKKRAGFSVDDLSPIDHAHETYIPALFAAADGDDFIRPHHSSDIYERYAGDKNIVSFDGDHNSRRPPFFYRSVSCCFLRSSWSRPSVQRAHVLIAFIFGAVPRPSFCKTHCTKPLR